LFVNAAAFFKLIVPEVLIVPPVNPSPVATEVTVPEELPTDIQLVPS